MSVVLNKATIERVAELYDHEYDRNVLGEYVDRSHLTGEKLAATGYQYPIRSHLTVDELQQIMDWKYPPGKTRKYAESNGAEDVEAVTGKAFREADPIEMVRTLSQLKGVWVAMSSAILMAFDPLRYTVLDWRAWDTLKELCLLDQLGLSRFDNKLNDPNTYGAYLKVCARLADDANVSLRTLDKCLWTISERKLYRWAQRGITLGPLVNPRES